MEPLKILIVDDEKYAGILIANCVNWAVHGFQVAGCAQSSAEALALFEQEHPDLVFCDVSMPVMDGLELSRRMKELRPDIRIVIITGYREFEYARKAIHIGVEEYVLKPVQAEELLQTAERIKEEIAASRDSENPDVSDQNTLVRNEITRKAIEFIDFHLAMKGLSLRTIAVGLYVNGSYLSRIFKEETNENITDYILRRRMERSKELFDSTDLRVYEVSMLVGMPDAHYFGQCFKRYTGRTVNEYRQKS